jgi:hypothetical protein
MNCFPTIDNLVNIFFLLDVQQAIIDIQEQYKMNGTYEYNNEKFYNGWKKTWTIY